MDAITSLPITDHDGESTVNAVYRVLATLRAAGVLVEITPGCKGFWYDGDDLYADEVIVLHLSGDETAMRRALARFGEDAKQFEVLFVQETAGYVVAHGEGDDDAKHMAREHCGATMFPNGKVVSYRYAALVHGRDYVSTVTGAVVLRP